ncbi:MAG: c-type cytochrome domain-containing protein, partial [Pirellulaceae bacterium]
MSTLMITPVVAASGRPFRGSSSTSPRARARRVGLACGARRHGWSLAGACWAVWLAAGPAFAADPAAPAAIDFSRDIRPVLVEKCINCHSGEEPEGGLRLGEREAALAVGDSGRVAIVPGKPA